MRLYEFDAKIVEAWGACVDPETGEINDELYAEFEALSLARDEKIEGIALWVKDLKKDANGMKAEIKTLQERIRIAENHADRLSRYLEEVLNGEKFSTAKVSISWRKSTTVECDDLSVVPFDYLCQKDPELDKTAVKEAFKRGDIVAGCKLAEHQNMTIK